MCGHRTDLIASRNQRAPPRGRSESSRWHALRIDELWAQLRSTESGLSESEAAQRLLATGPNRLPVRAPPSFARIYIRQFHSPLVYILGIATVVSISIGETTDALFILAVLILNASIGGFQEWRAEQSSRALQQLLRTRATVQRNGEIKEIDSEWVVPGDVLWLESGNRVPADVRLVVTHGLVVDESLLTGESLPVLKEHDWIGPEATPLGDRKNTAHAGSVVARGRGRGVVVATGVDTVVGSLALDVSAAPPGKPPLLVRMEQFTRVIGGAVLAAACLIVLTGALVRGQGVGTMIVFAIALAVSAIPEGLPVAMTVALSVATRRMARRSVIVRRLAAVEGLGSCTLIATDKTGTLTCNELTVGRVCLPNGSCFEVSGAGYAPEGGVLTGATDPDSRVQSALHRLARTAVLCNEGHLYDRAGRWAWTGDSTDVAMLAFAHKLGLTREAALAGRPQINEIAFEPERKYAATFHRAEESVAVFVKGAPERVVEMCAWADPEARADALAKAVSLAAEGYRVLALAEGVLPEDFDSSRTPAEPAGLAFLGFVGMNDPLRPGAKEAVAICTRAGIEVTMITGDHPVTALAIARDLGMASSAEEVVTGAQLAQCDTAELARDVRSKRVFARVSPHQKLDIVNSARQAGHFVAVTGDGVNDAAALRAANIGVAMGREGTDVAREAAELVLADDNFATIAAGIEEGRVAYDNVRKVIYLLISTGGAEVVLVLLAVAAGIPLPLLPVQLLWLNLVTNGIQDVALAFEPKEHDVLHRRPRAPTERIFNRLMIERTLVGALVIGGVGFAAFWWMIRAGWTEAAARNALLLLMVLFENVHIGNCRSETASAFRLSPLRSPILLIGTVTALSVHVLALYLPALQGLLGTSPVDAQVWVALVALSLSATAALEIHKWTWSLRRSAALGDE
ncbi:MAG: cation-translocating P-type ATPase [Planctomycetota bacterium]